MDGDSEFGAWFCESFVAVCLFEALCFERFCGLEPVLAHFYSEKTEGIFHDYGTAEDEVLLWIEEYDGSSEWYAGDWVGFVEFEDAADFLEGGFENCHKPFEVKDFGIRV